MEPPAEDSAPVAGNSTIEERLARLEQRDERLTLALEALARRDAEPAAKPGRRWDAFAAVIASLVGLLALAIAAYTAYVQRTQLRAQAWPHLRLEYSSVDVSFSARNEGSGPARIAAVRVTLNGAPVKTWQDIKKTTGLTELTYVMSTFSFGVLLSGSVFTIAKAADSAQSRAAFAELFPDGKHALSITVCYCSILDECWVTAFHAEGIDNRSIGSDECSIRDDERFED